ncbi:MAG: glycosyltransferase family 9 protein [Campylobacteraceae bacterium]|nr:glycosyltransferase family 9 protein [Campylobacteraceae bacterium]
MNILVTRHDKIGDFMLSLPMFKVLKTQKKDIKTFALVSKINYSFAKEISFIDEVILYDINNLHKTLKDIKKAKIDISISAFIDGSLGYLLFKAGIKTRISPATKLAQIFFNKRLKQKRSKVEKKEFEYNLDLLKKFDDTLELKYDYPLLNVEKKTKDDVLNTFKNEYNIKSEEKIIAFHPGFGGSSDGNLSFDDYIRLAQSISKIENTRIVFTFGPDDLDSLEYIHKNIKVDVILYQSSLSLMHFCALLSNFEVFVSTSTGPMHLAGAVNIKTLSFFGSSLFASSKRWATISEEKQQHNFMLSKEYTNKNYLNIENTLKNLLS